MTQYKTIDDLGDLNGKVVMLRADLNVPMNEKFEVTNTARIDRTVPTIKELMRKGATHCQRLGKIVGQTCSIC